MNNKLILRSETSPFGDITKGSVLSHSDVDNNFLFLKGQLISTGVTSGNTVTLTRINGETILFPVGSGSGGSDYWISGSTGINSIKAINLTGLDATGDYSVAINQSTIASGISSFASGRQTIASGGISHAEGYLTKALGPRSHSEGYNTRAIGDTSHAEGNQNYAGIYAAIPTSIVNGLITISDGVDYSSVFSSGLVLINGLTYSFNTINYSAPDFTIQLDDTTINAGDWVSNTDNLDNTLFSIILGNFSHAEGQNTIAIGLEIPGHAEGGYTIAAGNASHAEGLNTRAIGQSSHAEGGDERGTIALGDYSHAEGIGTIASGNTSHAEGEETTSSGRRSHTEGYLTTAIGNNSHAEGYGTLALGGSSHAEGGSGVESRTIAMGFVSHAEGDSTTAIGSYSHSGGFGSIASGDTSFVHGINSIAGGSGTTVLGVNITGTSDNTVYVGGLNIGVATTGTTNDDLLIRNTNGDVYLLPYSTITQSISGNPRYLAYYNDDGVIDDVTTIKFNTVSGLTAEVFVVPDSTPNAQYFSYEVRVDPSTTGSTESIGGFFHSVKIDDPNTGNDFSGYARTMEVVLNHSSSGIFGGGDALFVTSNLGDGNSGSTFGQIGIISAGLTANKNYELNNAILINSGLFLQTGSSATNISSYSIGGGIDSGSSIQNYYGYGSNLNINGNIDNYFAYQVGSTIGATANLKQFEGIRIEPNILSSIESFTGVRINSNISNVLITGYTGIDINPSGTNGSATTVTGLKINLEGIQSPNIRKAIDTNGGSWNRFNGVELINGFDQINLLIDTLIIASGSSLTGDVLVNNNATLLQIENTYTTSLGLGICYNIYGGQIASFNGSGNVETLTFYMGGASIPQQSSGGTVQNLNVYRSAGIFKADPSAILTVDNLYHFKGEEFDFGAGTLGTNVWGVYIEDTRANNYLAKNLNIGGVNTGSTLFVKGYDDSSNYSVIVVNSADTSMLSVRNDNLIILGNISGNSSNTTYVDNFNIKSIGSGSSITNLGVDSNGNVVSGTSGGSISKYSTTTGLTGSISLTISHGLNTNFITTSIWDNSTGDLINGQVTRIDNNNVNVTVSTTGTYDIVIIG